MVLYLCILFVGFTIGFIFSKLTKRIKEIHGEIDVDQITGLCRFRLTSDKIADRSKKYAIFKINHDVDISRDEQCL